MTRLMIVATMLVGFGCDSASTGPVPASVAQDGCRDTCQRDQTCDPNSGTTLDACIADCTGEVTGAFREDAFVDIAACVAALPCTADEDTCIAECSPTSAHQRYETKCRAKVAECGGMGGDVDSLCEVTPVAGTDTGFLCVVTPTVIDEMGACFDMPCTAIEGCLSAVFEKYGLGN